MFISLSFCKLSARRKLCASPYPLLCSDNTIMSYSDERLIEFIINDTNKPRNYAKDPCGICKKKVKTDQKAIQCDSCESWVHISCNKTSPSEYEQLVYKSDLWHCRVCNIKNNAERLPFTICDNFELININNSNSMRFLESPPNLDIVNESLSFTDDSSNDCSIELPNKTNCNYYSVNDYQLLNKKNKLNIFHSNINGLGSKIDNRNVFLASSSTMMGILTLTETSEKEDTGFLINVEIAGYEKFHTASKTGKGGTAIYVNKNYNTIERNDLNANNAEFESTWIEIKNKNSKNIMW